MSFSNYIDALRIDRYMQRNVDLSNITLDKIASMKLSSWILLTITLLGFLVPLIIVLPPLPLKFSEALVQTHALLTVKSSRAGNLPAKSLATAAAAADGPAAAAAAANKPDPVKIDRLAVYPVVPCHGIELAKSKVVRRGMQYDALYAFVTRPAPTDPAVDAPWDLLLPAACPNLGRLAISLWVPDIIKTRGSLDKAPNEAFIILGFPCIERGWQGLLAFLLAKVYHGLAGLPEKEALLPVEFPTEREIRGIGYPYRRVRMGGATVRLLDMACELPRELPRFLDLPAGTELGLVRVDRCLDGESESSGTREIRALCLVPEKLETGSKEFMIQRPNVTVTESLSSKTKGLKKIRFSQGDALFSSDWSYSVSPYADGALQLVPDVDASSKTPESWLEVGMGVVLE